MPTLVQPSERLMPGRVRQRQQLDGHDLSQLGTIDPEAVGFGPDPDGPSLVVQDHHGAVSASAAVTTPPRRWRWRAV